MSFTLDRLNVDNTGNSISHVSVDKYGFRKQVGIIYEGRCTFTSEVPERMTIISGSCRILTASGCWAGYEAGKELYIPANTSFVIIVEQGTCEYVITFEQ